IARELPNGVRDDSGRFLDRQDLPSIAVRNRLDEDVLVVVVEIDCEYLEPRESEEAGERARCEVRAMLVVDVPERALPEDAQHIPQLEEHDGLRTRVEGAPGHP